jgi:MFS family permease
MAREYSTMPAPSSSALTRCAVSVCFFINGVVLASWVPHIPAVKARHAISDGQLGLVLLAMAVGSVFALPIAGWLINRFGSRRMTIVAALGFCLTLPVLILSPHLPSLVSALLLFGACNGLLDVSMNAQAVEVERGYKRPIMSSFHGLFSLGGLVGAGVAGLAMGAGLRDVSHVATVMVVTVLGILGVRHWLAPSVPQPHAHQQTFMRPSREIVGLGMLAFFALLTEGAMADWSAVYLHDVLRTDSAFAAFGFATCSLMMAIGRFGGDWITKRVGSTRLLQASATLAALGLGSGLLIAAPAAAIIGFGLVGLGIANIIPVLFSAAGRISGMPPGTALAAVASTGYFGLLAGPPLIGVVAEISNLSLALGLVSVGCVLIAASASGVLAPTQTPLHTATATTQTSPS